MKTKALFQVRGMIVLGCLGMSLMAPALLAKNLAVPPTISSVAPPGARCGSTVVLTVEGRSLTGARSVVFDAPGLVGKVLRVVDVPEEQMAAKFSTAAPIPTGIRGTARIELKVAPDAEVGLHRFRLQTPLGTSNMAVLDIDALPEVKEAEPNDSLEQSQHVELPSTIVGTLGSPGDVDTYQFSGHAGEELIFQVVASALGSQLQSVLVLRDSAGEALAKAGEYSRQADAVLTSKLPADGKYTITVSDLEKKGGRNYFYRLKAGGLPYVTEFFPLGVRAGQSTEVAVKGVNLGDVRTVKVEAPPYSPDRETWQTLPLRVKTSHGESLNKLRLAIGDAPEVMEQEPNHDATQAQRITIPVTINGHISSGSAVAAAFDRRDDHARAAAGTSPVAAVSDRRPDEDYFRFAAKKGQHLTIEVAAARLGSPLDSVVEVLDAEGHEIPRAVARSVLETSLTLNDRDSKIRSFRLASITDLHPNDYLMAGEELVQIEFVPDQPDADVRLKGLGGERLALLGTSPQAHPLNGPVYKVRVYEPGKEFPPNGLPVFHLTMRNDDGGPGYGTDSHLDFIAPQDGEYLLRIKDVRGLEGNDFAYRLMVREATPDFTLTASPSNPNVPCGGRVPVQVAANRTLGYEGPIEVQVKGLPRGVAASAATIGAGQDSTVVILEAAADASLSENAFPFQIIGRAKVDGRELVRVADADQPLRVVSMMPPPDLLVAAEPPEVILDAGKETKVTLHVERKNGFEGRVPCSVMNLPPGVTVVNVGLNGVLVPEGDTSQTFTLRAENWVWATEQPIYVVGEVESNSPTRHASAPLKLRVRSKKEMASARR